MKENNHFPDFLKIAALNYPKKLHPYALHINGNKTIYTEDARLLSLLADLLNFRYEIVIPEDGQYGAILPNGNWTGLVGMLQRQEADLVISRIILTYERSFVAQFSYPYQYSTVTFITDNPEYSYGSFGLLNPFTLSVWVTLAISLFLMLALSSVFKNKREDLNTRFLNMYGSLLGQPMNFTFRNHSTDLFVISWILGAFLTIQAYKAVFLSTLTIPTLSGIQNITELSKASEDNLFKCSTYEGSYITKSFLDSKEESLQKIGECLTRSMMHANDIKTFLLPRSYKKAFIGLKYELKSYQNLYFVSEDLFTFSFASIALRKGFCCKEVLDKVIHRVTTAGLFYKFEADEQFFGALSKTPHGNNDKQCGNKKLTLQDLVAAFVCLGTGLFLSFVVLAMEMFFGKSSGVARMGGTFDGNRRIKTH